jgi:ketosteroid isomerase-like protein
MKILIATFIILLAVSAHSDGQVKPDQDNEKIIKGYFAGWVKKDWQTVASHLAEGFTFTSAAPDDHISIKKFKEKCWVQADHIERFEFPRIVTNGNEAFAIVHVITKDNKVIRNIEYFHFENGKIKSIEVFFGGNGQGFPTNEQ